MSLEKKEPGDILNAEDINDIIDATNYTQSNGINISNKQISIQLDPATNSALTLSNLGLNLDLSSIEQQFEWIELT